MKDLKEFLELLAEDKKLFLEVEKVENDSAKIVEIAKKHGYEFTEQDYEDEKMAAVNGGILPLLAAAGIAYLVGKYKKK